MIKSLGHFPIAVCGTGKLSIPEYRDKNIIYIFINYIFIALIIITHQIY